MRVGLLSPKSPFRPHAETSGHAGFGVISNGAERAVLLPRGALQSSDRRERKAAPKGAFGRTRKRPVRGLGRPQQAAREYPKGYPRALLALSIGNFCRPRPLRPKNFSPVCAWAS